MNDGRLSLGSYNDLAPILKSSASRINEIISRLTDHYGSFKRPKPDGSDREITPPKKELKEIQRNLKAFFDKKFRWANVVHGGIKGRSSITNAETHLKKAIVGNLDISKFFPNTSEEKVYAALKRCGCAHEAAEIITALTTFKGGLPQGSPTSMILGNLVLEPMDSAFMGLCKRQGLHYTRYVDDLTFSGPGEFKTLLYGVFQKVVQQAGYTVSTHKTQYNPRGQEQIVTGLIVNDVLKPSPQFVRDLRHKIKECWPENLGVELAAVEEGLSIRELKSRLTGQAQFVHHVNKSLGREIRSLLTKIEWSSPELSLVSDL